MSTAPRSAGSRLRERLSQLIRRPFVRDVGMLQLAALISAAVGFGASIILARTLGADQYGTYALVVSLGTTVGLLRRLGQDHAATSKLASAVALGDAELARRALSYFVALGVWSAIVVIPIALIIAPAVTERLYGSAELGELLRLYLIPVAWVVVAATTGLALQCTRHISQLAWLENGSTILLAIAAVAGALLVGSAAGVLMGQLIGAIAIGLAAAWVYGWLRAREPLLPRIDQLSRGVARPDFPVWPDTRSGLAMALDKNLATVYPLVPVLFLGAVAPSDDVAHLRVALSYVAIPALLLAPISRLLMVKLPEVQTRTPERLRSFFVSVSASGGLASLGLTLPFALLAPLVIPALYGAMYAESVPLVHVLAMESALLGFGLTAGPLFRTLDRTDLPIRVHLAVLLIGLPASYVVIQRFGPLGAAASYVALMLTVRLVTNALCWRLLTR